MTYRAIIFIMLFSFSACKTVPDEKSPKAKIRGKYMLRSSDSIHEIAMQRYGHSAYVKVIQEANGKYRFKAGDPLALPAIQTVCKDLATVSKTPAAMTDLSKVYYLYREVEPTILAIKYPDLKKPKAVAMSIDEVKQLQKVAKLGDEVVATLEKAYPDNEHYRRSAEALGKVASYIRLFANRKIIIEAYRPDFIHINLAAAIADLMKAKRLGSAH